MKLLYIYIHAYILKMTERHIWLDKENGVSSKFPVLDTLIYIYNSASQEKYKCTKDNMKHPIVDLIINDCCPELTVVTPLVHITLFNDAHILFKP